MYEIIERPVWCDSCDAYHRNSIHIDDEGKYTIFDGCDHEYIDEDDVNSFIQDADGAWAEYKDHVKSTGTDPLGFYYVNEKKTVTANLAVYFQRWIGEPDYGLAITTIRVNTSRYKGVYNPEDCPREIAEYLCLEKTSKASASRWVTAGLSKDDIQDAGEVTYMGNDYFLCRVEWQEPKKPATIKRELRKLIKNELSNV
jgi:hypothetical protein